MTKKTRSISPDYCSFYISGAAKIEVPLDFMRRGLAATPRCINVTCLNHHDGETTIELGTFAEINEATPPKFDGLLMTPDKVVILSETNPPEIMRSEVPDTTTRVRIWTNHETEPDLVRIALG